MRIGLFGYGHLGKIHKKCLAKSQFELAGIYDPKYSDLTELDGVRVYKSEDDLIESCDACIVASSTSAHFETAVNVLSKGKHLFLEKPMAQTLEQSRKLSIIAAESPDLITQVGFVERYNPAFVYLKEQINSPKFIEVHRLSTFNDRGNDVSVVSDLMIHDIDLILDIMESQVKEIKAHGISLISDSLDICNVRLEFENRAVANLTASRMSMKRMRKFRIFQEEYYLSMDLEKKESQIINISDSFNPDSIEIKSGEKTKYLDFKSSGALEGNAIENELNDFYNSIVNKQQSKTNLKNALRSTELAHLIEVTAKNSIEK